MIRILIVDDHTVVRNGLALILDKIPKVKLVASLSNGEDALNWLRGNDCDLAFVDIAMPGMNGIDLLKQLRKERPKLPVLIFSAHPEDQYAVRLIKAGAAGYLNKECAPEVVVGAMCNVLGGKKYISPAVAEMLAKAIDMQETKLPHELLSNREYEILLLIASAKSIVEIASILKLSANSISTYRKRILDKMNLDSNAELMRYSIAHNLVYSPNP